MFIDRGIDKNINVDILVKECVKIFIEDFLRRWFFCKFSGYKGFS